MPEPEPEASDFDEWEEAEDESGSLPFEEYSEVDEDPWSSPAPMPVVQKSAAGSRSASPTAPLKGLTPVLPRWVIPSIAGASVVSLLLGGLIGGLLFRSGGTADGRASDASSQSVGAGADRTEGTAAAQPDEEASRSEVRAALASAQQLLEQHRIEEFLHDHGPLEEYLPMLQAIQGGKFRHLTESLSETQLQLLNKRADEYVEFLKSLKDSEVHISNFGRRATLTPPTEPAKPVTGPYLPIPYPEGAVESVAGYGDDPRAVIMAVLTDLGAGRYSEVMTKMIPPQTQSMMKADGRWEPMLAALSADSPMITTLIADLSRIQDQTPVINGTTATYQVDRVVHLRVQGMPEEAVSGTREIRFSQIGGHWRFFENMSETVAGIRAADSRAQPEFEVPLEGVVLIRVGNDWRFEEPTEILFDRGRGRR